MPEIYLHGESPLKLTIGFLFLAFFFCMGIAHVVDPDRFLRRSGVRRGGEMLNGFNRFGFRVVGLVVALFALGILYDVGGDLLRK
jgi:hypothetical protein